MTVSSRLASGSESSETGNELVEWLMAVLLSSARNSRTARPRRAAGRAALSHAGYQIIAGLQVAVKILDQLGKSMIRDPSLDTHRLQRLISQQLPHDLSIVFRNVTLGCSG